MFFDNFSLLRPLSWMAPTSLSPAARWVCGAESSGQGARCLRWESRGGWGMLFACLGWGLIKISAPKPVIFAHFARMIYYRLVRTRESIRDCFAYYADTSDTDSFARCSEAKAFPSTNLANVSRFVVRVRVTLPLPLLLPFTRNSKEVETFFLLSNFYELDSTADITPLILRLVWTWGISF